jgi:transposase
MELRISKQKSKKGIIRKYMQLVEAVYRPNKSPTKKVIAHLGSYDPILYDNFKVALKFFRDKINLKNFISKKTITIKIYENLLYLPIALISSIFRSFGIDSILNDLIAPAQRTSSFATMVEALVIHRCIAPGSKLSFQKWITGTAIDFILNTSVSQMNNTRVHRVMEDMEKVDSQIQSAIFERITLSGPPRIVYLDLTDTWFEAGGGDLARKGQTKAGHRCKLKINIALMVDEKGLPIRWELLPGALNESKVLPSWIPFLNERKVLKESVLIFDRGITSWDNIWSLLDPESGHVFLTSVKSDSIITFVDLNVRMLNQLQSIGSYAGESRIEHACRELGLSWFEEETYARDMGRVSIDDTNSEKRELKVYVYFNREIQETQRVNRKEKIRKVLKYAVELNEELSKAKQTRKEIPTLRKICQIIEKNGLTEILKVQLLPIEVAGKKKKIKSFQVQLWFDRKMYRMMRRYDGVNVLLGHPDLSMTLEQSIKAYRYKTAIEADFKTIKSVLKIQPTFHWTTQKIQSHVTICVLALLIERLIELKLESAKKDYEDLPITAPALLDELSRIQMMYMIVDHKLLRARTVAKDREKTLLAAIGSQNLLQQLPEEINYETPV